jgi:triosephosphate isomerase (TIM)
VSRAGGRLPLMAGNWKMNLTHLEAIALVQKLAFTLTDRDFDATEVAVLPPFTALRSVQTLVTGDKLRIRYGAQDISPYDEGAYTGDVSGPMLAKLACSYVLAGHSERRRYHGEDDATVNAKAKAALRSGITPIVCVGEDLAIRQAGDQIAHILAQLDGSLNGIGAQQIAGLVVAYEPVWAIGTGKTATPQQAQAAHAFVRGRIAGSDRRLAEGLTILYGGSVKAGNAAQLFAMPDVDGGLIGGASLIPDEFVAICRAAQGAQEPVRI